VFAALGVPQATVKFTAEYKGNQAKLNKVISSALIAMLVKYVIPAWAYNPIASLNLFLGGL